MTTYAAQLSEYPNKGKVGMKEERMESSVVKEKAKELADLIGSSKYTVVFTGAGISTAAGISDFRGPNGVWTCEAQARELPQSTAFREAVPTATHMALKGLMDADLCHYIVSQNVDGLHLKSGIPRKRLSEVHGNSFAEKCEDCGHEVFYPEERNSVGLKPTGRQCPLSKCEGAMRDTLLDWDNELPEPDHSRAIEAAKRSTLSICLGTSLQIFPVRTYPSICTRKNKGTMVIVNLQKTPLDSGKRKLVIRAPVDEVMHLVMGFLDLKIPSPPGSKESAEERDDNKPAKRRKADP